MPGCMWALPTKAKGTTLPLFFPSKRMRSSNASTLLPAHTLRLSAADPAPCTTAAHRSAATRAKAPNKTPRANRTARWCSIVYKKSKNVERLGQQKHPPTNAQEAKRVVQGLRAAAASNGGEGGVDCPTACYLQLQPEPPTR